MKKALKILAWILIGILALVIVMFLTTPLWLGPAVTTGANTLAPDYTGTKFSLAGAKLNPITGKYDVGELHLANPEGFSATDALSVSNLTADIEMGSLISDKIHIRDITIVAPFVSYLSENETNNFACILANVDKKLGPKEEEEEEDEGPGKKLAIDRLKVTQVRTICKGIDPSMELTLADFSMESFFKDDKNLAIKQMSVSELKVKLLAWMLVLPAETEIVVPSIKVTGFAMAEKPDADGGSQPTIDCLELVDVTLKPKMLPEIPLGDFKFENIGKDKEQGGTSWEDVMNAIMKKVGEVGGVLSSAAGALGKGVSNLVGSAAGVLDGATTNLLGNATGMLDGATTNILGGATKAIGDTAKKLGNLGGLLGGGDDSKASETNKPAGNGVIDAGKSASKGALDAGKAVGNGALDAGKAVGSGALDAGKAVGSGALDAGKAIGEGAKDAFKKVGNLFGN